MTPHRRALTSARFVLGKLGYASVIVLGVSVLVHGLFSLVPGGPAYAILGQEATPDAVAALNERFGLDQPVWDRYLDWVGGMLSGDFGVSFRTNRPVWDLVTERLVVTIELAVLTTLVALLLSVPVALICVRHPGGFIDRLVTGVTSAVISVPGFLIGLTLVYVFGIRFELLPILGWVPPEDDLVENLRHLVLPVTMLAAHEVAAYTRVLRGDLLTTLSEDFVDVARATGLPSRTILLRYALRPSTFTTMTLAGLNFGRLLGGTVIAETIFSLPGIGSLVIQGITSRDLPLIQSVTLMVAIAFVLINLCVDLLYAVADPRTRSRSDK